MLLLKYTFTKNLYLFTLYLHSTMLLLKLLGGGEVKELDVDLHSTMLLLKFIVVCIYGIYDSIYIPLCYYLNLTPPICPKIKITIYIPLCYYLNTEEFPPLMLPLIFTFHYATT